MKTTNHQGNAIQSSYNPVQLFQYVFLTVFLFIFNLKYSFKKLI